ncbi:MAG: TROVE domain-containing protein [Phenylobacterium sp.]|uniref:TROVE domain-containing protein n=1 Tax=Phenylobacterium sp. TaxID=1871053 RepID=UPI0012096223|nr:TROVE domain-containing protein [Phenylobacterium sp.]TAL29038.1 MAG: TROVE domain-containing protein [Phenylobacterium sp.]
MYARHLGSTPQTEALPGQIANSAGGFSFAVDDWTRLDRFLILGSEGGSYYAAERKLTIDNAACVERCVALEGLRTVARIVEVSDSGRAPKNEPALMALAIAAKRGNTETRRAAFAALPRVARIGTHLFHFAEYVKALGGWGRATTRAFSEWYLSMDPSRLALQAIKYQQRDGWSHRDLLRKAHPKTDDATRNAILRWMVKGWDGIGTVPHEDPVLVKIWAFERAKVTTDRKELIRLISDYDLPHECVPSEAKGDPAVWEAMLPSMGQTAMIRNLGKMTAVGLLKPLSASVRAVVDQLGDVAAMKRARIHPLSLLVALKTYQQGHGDKGSLAWAPVASIVDALDAGFYSAFKAVEPTGKRHLLALDVSGSMGSTAIAGMAGITPRIGSAAMALVTANVEESHAFMGFSHQLVPLAISPRQRLDDAVRAISNIPFGATDCGLPMAWAEKNKIPVDVFCVYTDNETYAGSIHPVQALQSYRQKTGIGAKLVVVGMVANEFTIADPADAGMLDVAGFDTAAPAVISDFARG